MAARRILFLWFPRLGVDRLIRQMGNLAVPDDCPFVVVRDTGNTQVLSSLSVAAIAMGLRMDQPLRDAHAMCSGLVTRLQNPQAEAAFLEMLARWAGKFSPWVAAKHPDGIAIDITGCTHLFGGEAAMMDQITLECVDLGVHAYAGLADTLGGAWALARYAGQSAPHARSGDAIDQEARATRSRAAKRRHWERGGTAPVSLETIAKNDMSAARIAFPGQSRAALAPLPMAALRLPDDTLAQLARLGLRRIGDISDKPRAPLARRFGKGLVLRLDQAMGSTPEPISPNRPQVHFATRLTLPDPIGLESDLLAGIDRMLPRLCEMLGEKGRGVRHVRLQAHRADGTMGWISVGLSRATTDIDRIRPLLAMKLNEIDAGFGVDMLRLEATQTEPLQPETQSGHIEAARQNIVRMGQNQASPQSHATAIDDLISRICARLGMDSVTRRHPSPCHIPEKCAQVLAAAWSEPASDWPVPLAPRPLLLWVPEPVKAPDTPMPPQTFRWRGRTLELGYARGPERIAPQWWFDDPQWRSGVRDYWVALVKGGERLWLFYAHGGTMSSGWFCHGSFV